MPSSEKSFSERLFAAEFLAGQYSLFLGGFGLAFFYLHLLKPHLPVWIAGPFFQIPWAIVFVIFFTNRPFFSPRLCRRYWLLAVCWYALFTVSAEIIWILGYTPAMPAAHLALSIVMTQGLMSIGWLSFVPLVHDYLRNPDSWML
jgi:hypothetical protein